MLLKFSKIARFVTPDERLFLIRPILSAYEEMGKLFQREEALRGRFEKNIYSRLRATIVQHTFERFVQKGLIPFLTCESNNSLSTYPYLDIQGERFFANICQTKYETSHPGNRAKYRNERAITGQYSLFPEENVSFLNKPRAYILLTHGGNRGTDIPGHICIGIPDTENRKWVERINILKEALNQGKTINAMPSLSEDEMDEIATASIEFELSDEGIARSRNDDERQNIDE